MSVAQNDHFVDITMGGNFSPSATSKVEGNWIPDTDDLRTLGDATHKWANIFATTETVDNLSVVGPRPWFDVMANGASCTATAAANTTAINNVLALAVTHAGNVLIDASTCSTWPSASTFVFNAADVVFPTGQLGNWVEVTIKGTMRATDNGTLTIPLTSAMWWYIHGLDGGERPPFGKWSNASINGLAAFSINRSSVIEGINLGTVTGNGFLLPETGNTTLSKVSATQTTGCTAGTSPLRIQGNFGYKISEFAFTVDGTCTNRTVNMETNGEDATRQATFEYGFIRGTGMSWGPRINNNDGLADGIVVRDVLTEDMKANETFFQVYLDNTTGGLSGLHLQDVRFADNLGTMNVVNITGTAGNLRMTAQNVIGKNGTFFKTGSAAPGSATIIDSQTQVDAEPVAGIMSIGDSAVGGIRSRGLPIKGGYPKIVTTTPYSAGYGDSLIECDTGSSQINLPTIAAARYGLTWTILSLGTACTAVPGTGTIDGAANYAINQGLGSFATFQMDSSGYRVVSASLYRKPLYIASNATTSRPLGIQNAGLGQTANDLEFIGTATNVSRVGGAVGPFGKWRIRADDGVAANYIELDGAPTGSRTATFPNNTGTVAELNLAQSWTAAQTFSVATNPLIVNDAGANTLLSPVSDVDGNGNFAWQIRHELKSPTSTDLNLRAGASTQGGTGDAGDIVIMAGGSVNLNTPVVQVRPGSAAGNPMTMQDRAGAAIVTWPNATTDAFPTGAIRVSGVVTGDNDTNDDEVHRLALATSLFRIAKSDNSVNLFQVSDTNTTLNGTLGQGTALKAATVTTGSIAMGSSAAVTLTFSGVFTSSSWLPVCSVLEATAGTATLRVHHIESITNTTNATAVVRIVNDDGAANHTGTLYCYGVSP